MAGKINLSLGASDRPSSQFCIDKRLLNSTIERAFKDKNLFTFISFKPSINVLLQTDRAVSSGWIFGFNNKKKKTCFLSFLLGLRITSTVVDRRRTKNVRWVRTSELEIDGESETEKITNVNFVGRQRRLSVYFPMHILFRHLPVYCSGVFYFGKALAFEKINYFFMFLSASQCLSSKPKECYSIAQIRLRLEFDNKCLTIQLHLCMYVRMYEETVLHLSRRLSKQVII